MTCVSHRFVLMLMVMHFSFHMHIDRSPSHHRTHPSHHPSFGPLSLSLSLTLTIHMHICKCCASTSDACDAKQEWDELISERDGVIDAQSRLLELDGPGAQRSTEWKILEARKLELDRRLTEVKPRVFGPDG